MKITERGQLTIPKELRDRYGITPATELEVLPREEGLLIIKKVGSSPFARFLGRADAKGTPPSTDRFLNLLRDEPAVQLDEAVPLDEEGDEDESGGR